MSDKPAEPEFATARASLRETVKWLVGIAAALGAVLAAGISFTALGKLEGTDLGLALVLGLVALCALMLALNSLLAVMLVKPFTLSELLKNGKLCNRIAESGTLPDGAGTLPELMAKRQECIDALRQNANDAHAKAILSTCNAEIARAIDLAAFMDLSDHTGQAIRHVALWAVVICLSTASIGLLIGRAGNDEKVGAAAGNTAAGNPACAVSVATPGADAGAPASPAAITLVLPSDCAEIRVVLPAGSDRTP